MKRRIAVLDCETDPFRRHRIPKPFIWGWYDGAEFLTFETCDEVAAFLDDQDCIVYAHNGGRFDWHFLLPYACAYDTVQIINGRIAKMRIGQAECRDSYNIIPVPLGAYKKDDIDYSIMERDQRNKPANRAAIRKYLYGDCLYLYELVSTFISRYGLKLTQAGAAMKQWAKISKRELPHTDAEFYEALSPFYYGGRVQCFESGVIDAPFKVYDINSAYPYAMLHKHPYSANYSQTDGFEPHADFVTVNCVSHGAFPYRGQGQGLAFPDDDERRTYTVTRWEYDAAIDTGTISDIDVSESITFIGHVDFADYINHFYEERKRARKSGDEAGSLFAKLLMNSLYGKFAANPTHYKNYMIVPMDVIAGLDACGWQFSGEFGPWGLAESPLAPEQQRFYNVATGASITGFVRAFLWRAICAAERVLYCDTDSIAVGRAVLPLGAELGQWKDEGVFDRAGIAGKKMYIFRGVPDAKGKRQYKTASKGVKLTQAQLWRLAKGQGIRYVPEVPTFSVNKAPVFVPRNVRFTA